MTVREFIKQDVACIVCDDISPDLYVGFVGPLELTPEGEKHFAPVLDFVFDLFFDPDTSINMAALRIRNLQQKDPQDLIRHEQAKEFFEAASERWLGEHSEWFKR